ncbi:MAG: enolase C-terminal domain-like protein [Acidimicrobiales bacterium]
MTERGESRDVEALRLEGFEVVVVSLALQQSVASAGRTDADVTKMFLRVLTTQADGWGECSAYRGARFEDPTLAEVETNLVDRVLAKVVASCRGGVLLAGRAVFDTLAPRSPAERSAVAAVEMAVFDAELRSQSRSLASLIGAARPAVRSGAMVGIPTGRDTGALRESVAIALQSGAARVRVKIQPGWDHLPLGSLRAAFPDAVLQADANGSFEPRAARELVSLDSYGLACLEQPFEPRQLDAHRDLAAAMKTPVGLDETLSSPRAVERALQARALEVACLKPGRIGGLMATARAAASCARESVPCFVGGFFESGLGRCANAALAGRPEFSMPADLGDPSSYLVANPFSYLECSDGVVTLSTEPGVGSTLDEKAMGPLVAHRRRFGA